MLAKLVVTNLIAGVIFFGDRVENKEVIDALNALIEIVRLAKDQPNAAVIAAQYTVYGMLGVAFITLLGQLVSTRFLVKSEMRKALVQVAAEREFEFNIEWNRRIQELVTELLVATDPELNTSDENKKRLISCVHSLNLLLNQEKKKHKDLDKAATELALTFNGWAQKETVLNLHDRLIQAARVVIYQPRI